MQLIKQSNNHIRIRIQINVCLEPKHVLYLHYANNNHNEVNKPYKCLQSQGHVKKWPNIVASLMLIALLLA